MPSSEVADPRFILNAIMTVVVATLGFFLVSYISFTHMMWLTGQIPDAPGMAKVFWMSREDDQISRWRLDKVKKLPPTVRLVPFPY
jgi:cadmium resistance protein CadD (predicted permease)